MNEARYFNQQRMALNSHAMRGTPERKKALSEIDRIIEKHERKGDLQQFMQQAQREIFKRYDDAGKIDDLISEVEKIGEKND